MNITQDGNRLTIHAITENKGIISEQDRTGTIHASGRFDLGQSWQGVFEGGDVLSGTLGYYQWSLRKSSGVSEVEQRLAEAKSKFGSLNLTGEWEVFAVDIEDPVWAYEVMIVHKHDRINGPTTFVDPNGRKTRLDGTHQLGHVQFKLVDSSGKPTSADYDLWVKSNDLIAGNYGRGQRRPVEMRRLTAPKKTARSVAASRLEKGRQLLKRRQYEAALTEVASFYEEYATEQLGLWATLLAAECLVRLGRLESAMTRLEDGLSKARQAFPGDRWKRVTYIFVKGWLGPLRRGATKERYQKLRESYGRSR
jgi:hypothetical protein